MNEQTVRALNAINRTFYSTNAREFDQARSAPWPGWERLLRQIEQLRASPLRVLDVGCGNGRFGAFLAQRLPAHEIHYCGIDSSPALISRARERDLAFAGAEFRELDFVEAGGELPRGPFSLIALFGILHHVPGETRRRELLRELGERLAPAGILALTTWQFEAFARFRNRLLPWPDYNRNAADPIDTAQLEPGDHLLPWGDEGIAHRYCHFTSEGDTRERLENLGFEIADCYAADGREGNLNRYFICRFSNRQVEPKEGEMLG
ncbi:MAG: class I SAM-dependent methyltransferase [Deltaproteobacteria bacterium]|jgi:SAM-dependent methyltransferase|nr:class I SAM-dependent methyltransferase [Deltaproteobacteria bacterium]MBW2542480.1 class I SAM-dependent methyltransferase [Deltaproteobacteria bacterium]